MSLIRHELGDRKTNAYTIAVQCQQRFAKSVHGGGVITDCAQCLSS